MQFVDGWELNGQYFPGVQDHELSLDKRIIEFCNDNKHWPLKQFNRVYRSSQNAALLQYRIPIRGQFVATVRFIHNPNRKLSMSNIFIIGLITCILIMWRGAERSR